MRWSSPVLVLLALSCVHPGAADSGAEVDLVSLESAPPESERVEVDLPLGWDEIDSWFEAQRAQRVYIQLDRPLVRPGEVVWIKSWSVATRSLEGKSQDAITYELLDPRGQLIETKRVGQQEGKGTNDFTIADDASGGKWTIRATLATGEVDERPFVVSTYQAPRIRKELEFLRQGYGAGDRVEARVELSRPNGEPLALHPVTALIQVDGQTQAEVSLETNAKGVVIVSGKLPAKLASGEGLLTVLVEDSDVTESISRSIPIVMANLGLDFFPEGGDLVEGLPSRVYFEAQNRHGEPADVEGYIEDDQGERLASFSSVHDGLGRFGYTPVSGRTYRAVITSPPGISQSYPLPDAMSEGCVLHAYDDLDGQEPAIRVGVRCSEPTEVAVVGVLRDATLDRAGVEAGPSEDAMVYLKPDASMLHRQGAVRVTVFADELPVAERLVYRNPGKELDIQVTADREQYGPRDAVKLSVRTLDPDGNPVSADLALAVVDDTVLALADDEEGNILTRLYLEPELVDSPDDPSWYFDSEEALAHRGLDLVMGTRGWRGFEWQRVWDGEMPAVVANIDTGMLWEDDMPMVEFAGVAEAEGADLKRPRPVKKEKARDRRREVPMAPPPPMAGPVPADGLFLDDMDMEMEAPMRGAGLNRQDMAGRGRGLGKRKMAADAPMRMRGAWAPVRVFPAPDYSAGFSGTRTDFRDTVHWEPAVHTDDNGEAELSFYLSDAITTFRITAEGLGGGFAGHAEKELVSTLPVSLATRLPAAISAGDRLDLPLIVSNTRPEDLRVGVRASFESELISATKPSGSLQVGADDGSTFWVPLEIGQGAETAKITLTAEGGGESDTLQRTLEIVPPGFPRSWSESGETRGKQRFTMRIDDLVDETMVASVRLYPSPVSSLMTGMEGLIREPGGCFEQTSSTNWPNVAIINYLEAHDADPELRVSSGRALKSGYDKLTGYQVDAGGFETWGSGPGKEVLSAFGLLQFRDMSNVYPVDASILSRDADYLLSQRDGKGGFKNTGESAHGYGSAPKPVLDGFITWSLASTGHLDQLSEELKLQERVADTSDDPYVLALAARTLLAAQNPKAERAVSRLAAMQSKDGSFPGAESSITRSYEANLLVESTALATLALMDAGGHTPATNKAAAWLQEARQGPGTWGATQATALALGALTTHADQSRRPRSGGTLIVEVNGHSIEPLVYFPEDSNTLEITGLERYLKQGDNEIVLRHDGESLPFSIDVAWTALNPETSPGAELSLATSLAGSAVKLGETVRLSAQVKNRTERVVPSPIARIGLPAGLEAQTWQLEQLQERGEIAFFETRPREVTLYWDGLKSGDSHEVDLDLVAFVAGRFTGPASRAYPYYNDDEKAWDGGLVVEVSR